METEKALNGKPYAGNPHIRFDDGEVAPTATPRLRFLCYSEKAFVGRVTPRNGGGVVLSLVLSLLLPLGAFAGVWDDCLAWYNGGAVDANGDGKFNAGEMLDVRHAGNPGASTHGGSLYWTDSAHDTVRIVTNEVKFPLQNFRSLQCPVLYFTAPAITNVTPPTANSHITVNGNIIKIPGGRPTGTRYSALVRFKRDEHHAWDSSYQYVLSLGRNFGGKKGLMIQLSNAPDNNNLYFGVKGWAQRDTGVSLGSKKEVWHELAVLADDSVVHVGVVETNQAAKAIMRWQDLNVAVAGSEYSEGSLEPDAALDIDLAGERGVAKTLFRGMIHMVAVWDRVLTTNEVLEAFSSTPSLFQVGCPNVDGGDVFAGASGGAVNLTAMPEDWRKFPASLAVGQPVNISFELNDLQTNLPQMVRLVPRAGTGGSVSVKVNGVVCGTKSLTGGRESFVYVPASVLRTGENVCTVTRLDGGAGSLGFNAVQMAGSWRIGWDDGKCGEMGSASTTGPDFYIEGERRWEWFRRAVTPAYPLHVHLGDVLGRWGNNRYVYTWKMENVKAADGNKMVMKLNGTTLYNSVPLQNGQVFTLELDERNLLRGADNVLTWENDGGTSYYAFDYQELVVQKAPSGLVVIFQ